MLPQLTSGVIWACMNGEKVPSDPCVQILDFQKVTGQGSQYEFRLHISDGEFSHSFATFSRRLNELIYQGEIDTFAVVKPKSIMNNTMREPICKTRLEIDDGSRPGATVVYDYLLPKVKVIWLLELEVVAKGSEVGMNIGNPIAWVRGISRPQALRPQASSYDSAAPDAKPDSNGAPPTTWKEKMNLSSNGSRFSSSDSPSGSKKSKMENINVPTGAIAPIQDITLYTNQVTIRARVTRKSTVKTWRSGKGKLFSVDLVDESGAIQMTGFNTLVDVFYSKFEVSKVYYISKFTVKPARKQYTSIEHDCELFFIDDTKVIPCVENPTNIPGVTYDFVNIADIKHVDAEKIIDVIGVCKSVADYETVYSKKLGKTIKKRELVLVDQSRKEIALTIWGKTAEEFRDETKPIVSVKGVQVSDFLGKSLSCRSSSLFQVNPDLEQAYALRAWYDREGSTLKVRSLTRKARGEGSYFDDDYGSAPWDVPGGPWEFGEAYLMTWLDGGWVRDY